MFILGETALQRPRPLESNHIYAIEGILTCVVAMLFFFLIPDFPEEVSWLSAEERQFVKARLQEDVGESQRHKPMTPKDVFRTLRECELPHSTASFRIIKCAINREHHSWRIHVLRSHRSGLQLRCVTPLACLYTGPNLEHNQRTSRPPSSSLWATMPSGRSFCRYRHGRAPSDLR